MVNIPIPQLFSDMEHHHDQGKEKTPGTEGTLGCSVLQSTEVADGVGNTYVHWIHSPCNIMGTRSSPDT